MNTELIDETIKINKEKSDFLKKWFLTGIFGSYHFDAGNYKMGLFYSISCILSCILIFTSIYFILDNLINNANHKYSYTYSIVAFFIYFTITLFWIKDLLIAMDNFQYRMNKVQEKVQKNKE